MRGKRVFIGLRALAIFAVSLLVTSSWAATNWNEKVLHRFNDNGTDGWAPLSGLVIDAAGNLYGTTTSGGAYDPYGAAFELSPTVGGGWSETVLHNFNDNGSDGWDPQSGLIFDAAGNLYGTTASGGTYNGGTVFELSPMPGGGWTEIVLYSFGNGMDGAGPGYGSLIFDAAGNLYGTTSTGGTFECPNLGCGTVFKLTPTVGGAWTETVLYDFHNGSDGHIPRASLIFDTAGNLYGTTEEGGTGNCLDGQTHGCGTVFELTPTLGGEWTETVLHDFGSGTDGRNPIAGLIFDAAGNLYGTTLGGGAYTNDGTVFELSPAGGGWTETVLHSFNEQGSGGYGPSTGPLLFDAAGNLYGTVGAGGAYFGGTAFKLTPTVGGAWTDTVLYSFGNGTDGNSPSTGLTFDAAGNLYGTTFYGGTYPCGQQLRGCGTVFELTPVHPCIRCSHAVLP
jgi:uncharacterized repeat protein (TIGR03803 family)